MGKDGIAAGTVLGQRYRAEALVGRGGMGEVWRCRDLEQQRDVAVKLVRSELARSPWVARYLGREVAAVARLHHPGIVSLFDLGRDAGAAHLVMELCNGESLRQRMRGALAWSWVAAVLDQVLAALAYAHARGVLHLDVKPDNILVQGHGVPQVKLIDFGVARVRQAGGWTDHAEVAGTLAYMAPEQARGESARFGPWTDLFAVGVVLRELCARSAAPLGVGALCDWLGCPDPAQRCGHAGDARVALARVAAAPLVVAPMPADADAGAGADADADTALAVTALAPAAATARTAAGPAAPPLAAGELTDAALEQASAPWTRHAAGRGPLPGAYGLYGLRDLPSVGREAERDLAWGALLASVRERRARVVLIEGPAGVGKSRLARDLVERAAELGLCLTMRASWSQRAAAADGVRDMLEGWLDAHGLDADGVRARIELWLARLPGEHGALARELLLLLRPPPQDSLDSGLPARVLAEVMALAAPLRPLLLWLDDAHWAWSEAAAILDRLLAVPHLPVCAVVTVRSDQQAPPWLLELRGRAAVTQLELCALDGRATAALVRGLLDVDDAVCDVVVARSEGNPLFTTQLVDQIARAGQLEWQGGHYRLPASCDLTAIPDDIGTLWEERLASSGAGRRELSALALVRERVPLEAADALAGLLGADLDGATSAALGSGLLRVENGSFLWTHGLLREHLVRTIPAPERVALHAAAAGALAALPAHHDVDEERAWHLHAAERRREACEAMLQAGLASYRRGDNLLRRDRLARLADWAVEGELTDLAARAACERALLHAEQRDEAAADAQLAHAARLLDDTPDAAALGWYWLRRAQVDMRLGRPSDAAAAAARRSLEQARAGGQAALERMALLTLGLIAQRHGDRAAAAALCDEAVGLARAAGDSAVEIQALWVCAVLAPLPRALELCDRALAAASAAAATRFEVASRQIRSDLLHRAGRRDEARAEALTAIAQAERLALPQVSSLLHIQVATWRADAGDFDATRAHRDAARRAGAAAGAQVERALLAALDLLLAAVDGDRAAADRAAAELTAAGDRGDEVRHVMEKAAGLMPAAWGGLR